MGLDVPSTNLVVIYSSPSTAWEFCQEVELFIFKKSLFTLQLHLCINLGHCFSLVVLEGVAPLLCVSSSGGRARVPQRWWESTSSPTLACAWRRGLWKCSVQLTLMVSQIEILMDMKCARCWLPTSPQWCTKRMRRSFTVAKHVWTLVAVCARCVGLKSSFFP